jgi:hypothetical protein
MELNKVIVEAIQSLVELEMDYQSRSSSYKQKRSLFMSRITDNIASAVSDGAKVIPAIAKPSPPDGPRKAPQRGPRVGSVKLTDEQLFGALSEYLATPAQIADKLAKQGVHVSKALIYARMPKLMADRPGAIETFGKPVKYRLKPAQRALPVKPVKATTATKPRQPTLRKKRKGNPFALACSRIESLLTDELKTVSTITDEAGGNGWVYNNHTVARALYYLEKIGVATSAEIDGEEHFARAD